MENISVYIRIKPTPQEENKAFQIDSSTSLYNQKTKEYFSFDKIIDSTWTNQEVFNEIIKPTLPNILKGINLSIFAYGQTSTGKTYTMQGYSNNEGIIPLSIRDIFTQLSAEDITASEVKVSYIEIYNEVINDLLDSQKKNLEIRENSNKEIFVNNLTEIKVRDYDSVLSLLKKGENNRMVAETKLNEKSSRSHSVFRLSIELSTDNKKSFTSQLNLIDLAGSENASKTNCVGIRFKEGTNINKSLLALSNVINKLSQNQNQKQFVSYRDSKLTRLLQSSLGGNSKTAIICTITDDVNHYSETVNTLLFGLKAKNVRTTVKVNEVLQQQQQQYQGQIAIENEQLKNKIKELEGYFTAQKTNCNNTEGNIQIINESTIKDMTIQQEQTKAISALENEIAMLKSILQSKRDIDDNSNNNDIEVKSTYSNQIKRNLMHSNNKPNFKRLMTTAKKTIANDNYYPESAIKGSYNYESSIMRQYNENTHPYNQYSFNYNNNTEANNEGYDEEISEYNQPMYYMPNKLQKENEELKNSIYHMKIDFYDLMQNKEKQIQALTTENQLTVENCDRIIKEADMNYLALKNKYEEEQLNKVKAIIEVEEENIEVEDINAKDKCANDDDELVINESNEINERDKRIGELTELNKSLMNDKEELNKKCNELSLQLTTLQDENIKIKSKLKKYKEMLIQKNANTINIQNCNENNNPNMVHYSVFNTNSKPIQANNDLNEINLTKKNLFLNKKRTTYLEPSVKLNKTPIKKLF